LIAESTNKFTAVDDGEERPEKWIVLEERQGEVIRWIGVSSGNDEGISPKRFEHPKEKTVRCHGKGRRGRERVPETQKWGWSVIKK